jgi:hypothetical protein
MGTTIRIELLLLLCNYLYLHCAVSVIDFDSAYIYNKVKGKVFPSTGLGGP